MFSMKPERKIEGCYGKGPVDYAIEMKGTGGGVVGVGVTEVKENDFQKGCHRTRFGLSLFCGVGSGKLTRSWGCECGGSGYI